MRPSCTPGLNGRIPLHPRPQNKNWFLTLVQLVAVSVGVLTFRGGSCGFLAHDTSKRVQGGSYL